MGSTTRTFFAIEIPENLGLELARLRDRLVAELPGCRPTTSTPFHMTLAFVGDVPDVELTRVHRAVTESVSALEPLELSLQGLGAFPSPRRPRVLWAGLSAHNPNLLDKLRQSVVAALSEIGFPCDEERFHPHVTLGRFRPDRHGPCDATAVVERYRSWSLGGFVADEVVGFASRESARGPVYDHLSRARLLSGKSGSPP